MNIQVNFGALAFSTSYNINRIVGTPEIEMRIAGRSTAFCQIMADSTVVAPSTFALGTQCNIQNFCNQPGNDGLHLVSSSTGDTTQTALIVGTDQADALQYESVVLNGTTPVNTTNTDWKLIHTVTLSEACAGVVTVQEASGDETIVTIPVGTTYVSDRLFSGFLESITLRKVVENDTSTYMLYDCSFVDVAQVLERRVCLEDYADTTVGAIISDLLTSILASEGFVASWGGTSQILPSATAVDDIKSAYKPVSEVLDELAKIAGCAWWVDPYRCLHMGNVGDSLLATPFPLSESVPARNISVEKTKGEYRNREYYLYDQVWITTKTVERLGDGKTNAFLVSPNIYSIASGAVTVNSVARVVKTEAEKNILVTSSSGGQFGNVYGGASDKLEAEADDPNDNRDVTVIYVSDTDSVVVETKSLPTGSPNKVQFTYTNMKALCAVKINGGDPGVGTVVTIQGTVGSPVTTYVEIYGSGDQTAGVTATGDTTTYYVRPQIAVTNDPTHEHTRWCIISYTNTSGVPDRYQATSLAAGVLTGAFDTVAKSVEELYVGDFTLFETVSLYCEAEYQYTVNDNAIRVSSYGTAPSDGASIAIEYTPMWKASYTEIDGGTVTHSDIASLEGIGTGYYDHVTTEKEAILATEAEARAAALGDKFGDFPRKVYFETDTDWFFPGQKLTVNLASNFAEDGTEYVVTEVSMRERSETQADGYQFQYGVTAMYGEDYSAFDKMEVYRRLKQKARVWVPADNLNS